MATKNLSALITIGGTMTAGLKGALGSTSKALKDIGSQVGKLKDRQKELNNVLKQAERSGKFSNAAGYAIAELRDVESRLNRIRAAQTRLNEAVQTSARLNATASKLRTTGAGMTVAGGAILMGARPMIGAAIQRENEINIIKNSGLPAGDQAAMISAATNARQFGVSTTDAFKTIRELQASLGDAHHAIEALPVALQAKSGLQLYNREHAGHEIGDESMYSLAKIADERGGATSSDEMRKQMNAAFKGITAAQGKVSAEDWLAAQRGAKSAGIGMSNNAFFGDSFMVQALGSPQYGKALSTLNNAFIGGHQDGHKFFNMVADGLVDGSKVKVKNGMVSKYKSDALVDNKLFIEDQQAWVEKYLVPLASKKHVDLKDSASVQKFVSDYTSNPSAGNVLFQRLFNRTAIERDRRNYVNAHGIEDSDAQNKASSAGKQADAQARYNDAMQDFGKNILPLYTTALTTASEAMKKFNDFAEKHGMLVKAAGVAIVGLGAALTVLGPIVTLAGVGLSAYSAIQLRAAAAAASSAAAIGAETTAIEAQGAAAVASGGKLAAFGRRLIGVLALANVGDYVAGKLGVGKDKANQAQDDANWNRMNWWQHAQSGMARGIEGVGRFIGMTNIADQAQADRVKAETSYLNKAYGTLPDSPGLRAKAAAITQNNTFNVTQQPGESGDAFAKRVADYLKRQQGVQQRGSLTDGATAN